MSLVATTVLTTPIFDQKYNGNLIDNESIVVPYGMDISDGMYSGTQFSANYTLNKDNGKKVNFYVENNASEPVIIEINGSNSRTLKSGESGHISASVTGKAQKFTFKARAGVNGGKINISYIIKQRD